MSDWNSKPELRFQEMRESGQMVCIICGRFSSAVTCWPCSHLGQMITEACAAKNKRIAELCAELRQMRETTSADPRIADLLMEAYNLRDRIAEARKVIEHVGWMSSERPDVITAAEKWLEGKP